MESNLQGRLLDIYQRLLKAFGPRHWWPAKTPFEVVIGAVLAQAVAWRNVEKAIANLEQNDLMSPVKIYNSPTEKLEELLRPTRYFKMKTKKVQALLRLIVKEYRGDLNLLFAEELTSLRKKLLSVYGLGPETVDSILLYAGGLPVFVVDEYTKRVFARLGYIPEKISYSKLQDFFMANLPKEVQLYNEYHALIVYLGNQFCHIDPACAQCPLSNLCLAKSAAIKNYQNDSEMKAAQLAKNPKKTGKASSPK